ncbi:META domain-containing protein [Sinomicrobium oceani]|uniref:META domain-containing protein n=1 Tax=Sinomicrobium oceani TaxID=1150368 RepID=UPI00227B6923|nr:META domain-containing protein [Sinomicrobium oceani]
MKNIFRMFVLVCSMVAILVSCNSEQKDPLKTLSSKVWKLDSFAGEKADSLSFANGMPYLEFDKEKMHVSGFSGCNRLMGGFTVGEDHRINLDKLASTKMACMGVNKETDFLAALSKADHYKVKDRTLQLRSGDEELMTFVPKEDQ